MGRFMKGDVEGVNTGGLIRFEHKKGEKLRVSKKYENLAKELGEAYKKKDELEKKNQELLEKKRKEYREKRKREEYEIHKKKLKWRNTILIIVAIIVLMVILYLKYIHK